MLLLNCNIKTPVGVFEVFGWQFHYLARGQFWWQWPQYLARNVPIYGRVHRLDMCHLSIWFRGGFLAFFWVSFLFLQGPQPFSIRMSNATFSVNVNMDTVDLIITFITIIIIIIIIISSTIIIIIITITWLTSLKQGERVWSNGQPHPLGYSTTPGLRWGDLPLVLNLS